MKARLFLSFLTLAVAHLFFGVHAAEKAPVITEQKEVAKHVGEEVTLVGEVSNTKIPQILGVDVASDKPDLRGRKAEATGMLERYEVTAAQVKEMDRVGIAHRGAGVFYRLRDEKRKTEAPVRERK